MKLALWIIRILLVIILLIGSVAFLQKEKIVRLYKVIHLFDEDVIVDNFLHMEDIFNVDTIRHGESVFEFQHADAYDLPSSFSYNNSEVNVQEYLDRTQTNGLLILHGDTILKESYYRGNGPEVTHISWSVAKSLVSSAVGKALEEGYIETIEDPITKYVPGLKDSAYDGVRIKDILQMSSGAGFDEDYHTFGSDINRLGRYFALGMSLDRFCTTLDRERPPGTYHNYVSTDTQVLGMLVREATGMEFSDFFESRIWDPIGAEGNAYWIEDNKGMEAVFGGMNARLKDFGRFGYMYGNGGRIGDRQVISPQWIRASTTPDAPHLLPGDNPLSSSDLGYGYQWWIPEGDAGEFMAIGVYNQYIYIHPSFRIVIVKQSANLEYKTLKRKTNHEALAFFRSVAGQVTPRTGIKKTELESTF